MYLPMSPWLMASARSKSWICWRTKALLATLWTASHWSGLKACPLSSSQRACRSQASRWASASATIRPQMASQLGSSCDSMGYQPPCSSVHRHPRQDALTDLVVGVQCRSCGWFALPPQVALAPALGDALEVLVKRVDHAATGGLDQPVVLGRNQQFVAEVKADILDHLASLDVKHREAEAHRSVAKRHPGGVLLDLAAHLQTGNLLAVCSERLEVVAGLVVLVSQAAVVHHVKLLTLAEGDVERGVVLEEADLRRLWRGLLLLAGWGNHLPPPPPPPVNQGDGVFGAGELWPDSSPGRPGGRT